MGELLRLIDLYGVTVRQHRLDGAYGLTCKTSEGYVMLIDDRLSEERMAKTIAHEFLHITLGHLDERAEISTEQKEEEVSEALEAMGF